MIVFAGGVGHGLGIAVEGVAPSAAAAVVVDHALAHLEGHPVSDVPDDDGIVGADLQCELVGLAGHAAADAGHRVLHADDVCVDLRRHPYFLLVVAAAEAAPLAGPAGVGAVVAAPLDVREDRLVDLGGGLPEVAEAGVLGTPGVHALGRIAPAAVDLGGRVDELRARARVLADDGGGDAGLVGLGHGLVGQHVLHGDGNELADVGARVVGARGDRLVGVWVQHAPLRGNELDGLEEAFVL